MTMDNEQSSGKKKEEFGKNKKDNKFFNFNSKTQIELFGNFIKTQELKNSKDMSHFKWVRHTGSRGSPQ